MKFLLLALFLSFFVGCDVGSSGSHSSTKKFIKEYIPRGAERIEFKDSHGGFHGDGELWAVYKLSDKEKKKFEERVKEDPAWKDLPVFEEASRFIHESWVDKADGLYFFYDFQPDWYAPRESLSKPPFQRGSFNFCLFFYDRKGQKIYVYNLDT